MSLTQMINAHTMVHITSHFLGQLPRSFSISYRRVPFKLSTAREILAVYWNDMSNALTAPIMPCCCLMAGSSEHLLLYPSEISSWPKKWWWRSQVPSWSGESLSDSITHSWTRPPTTCTGTPATLRSVFSLLDSSLVNLTTSPFLCSGFMGRTRPTCMVAWTAMASQWRPFMDSR